jgi:glycosyltransferase involved in cell wall biosynthesis
LFVLPSLNEGLPIALLEAMAMGKASIASRINAIPEAVIDNETGLLVEASDPDGLASAILKLADDTELRDRLGAAGQAFVLENFDERSTAKITVDYYEASRAAA